MQRETMSALDGMCALEQLQEMYVNPQGLQQKSSKIAAQEIVNKQNGGVHDPTV